MSDTDQEEQIRAQVRQEVHAEMNEARKKTQKRNRLKDMRYAVGWIIIGLALLLFNTYVYNLDQLFYYAIPWLRVVYVAAALIIWGIITTIWAFVKPRKS